MRARGHTAAIQVTGAEMEVGPPEPRSVGGGMTL